MQKEEIILLIVRVMILYQIVHINYKTVILDDSDEINNFAIKYDIDVIRHNDRKEFKAGNLNNY